MSTIYESQILLFKMFELSQEESDALHGFLPMSKEVYSSIINKCKDRRELQVFYENLLKKYPEFQENE